MHTADDDSGPVPYDTFRLPRAVLNWKPRYRAPVSRLDLLPTSRAQPPASAGSRAQPDEFDDEPTRTFDDEPTRMVIDVPVLPRTPQRSEALQILLARAAARLGAARARAAQLWRDGPLRTAAMMGGVALITYLAVGGVRHGSNNGTQTVLAPAAALPALGPIIVEQLNGALQPRETGAAPLRGEQSDRPSRRSAGSRAREASFATAPANKSGGSQAIAPAQSKSKARRAEPSSTTVASSSAGLPAWGDETVRDFSGSKGASATSDSQALTAKPPSSSISVPPPMAAYRPTATAPTHEQTKPAPVVAAKPSEPPKPVAPPRPSKPLTMDEVLNQVEEVAQAQRKQAGLKAPKTSKRDAELDELISGAMKSKKK